MAAQIPTLDEIETLMRRVVREELRRSSPETMTVEQAAAYTGRAPKTVRGWILAGLATTKKGRRVYVKRDDLDEWRSRGEPAEGALVASLRSVG